MSKLADIIKRAAGVQVAPIGFGAATKKATPSLALLAVVDERWAQRIGETAEADAFLLSGRPNDSDLAQAVAAASNKPCGLIAPQADAELLERAAKAGLDFLVVDTDAPARIIQDEKLSFVLHVRSDLSDMQLRAIEALPVDGIYYDRDTSPLTVLRQMELVRVSGLARKALVVAAGKDAQQSDLVALRDSGVVLVALDARQAGEASRLRPLIDTLPRRRKQKQDDSASALVPRVAADGAEDEGEDDD